MNLYSVYLNPHKEDPLQTVIMLKEGFSWGALLFSFLWAIYYQLWGLLFLMGFAEVTFALFEIKQWISPLLGDVIRMGFYLMVAFIAQDWRYYSLRRKGYVLVDVVAEKNEDGALIRFLDRYIQFLQGAEMQEKPV